MALEATRNYRLRWMDFDRYGHLQPAAVLDIFQDLATLHAEELGIGRDSMLERGVIWVVVRTKLEITADPEHFQVVTARTWPHSLSRFSFMRDFSLHDERGEMLAKATQEWVLMDVRTRKFASPKDCYQGPTDFCEDRAFPKKPRKTPAFDEGNRPVRTMAPEFTDLDLNGHVNNAMYANYILNALDPEAETAFKTFQIDYRYEALPGQAFTVHALVEEDRTLMKGVAEDGTVLFAAQVEPRP